MKVTLDKYELPVAVAESSAELAEILGISKNTIYSNMSHAKHQYGSHKRTPYRKIVVDDLEDET